MDGTQYDRLMYK